MAHNKLNDSCLKALFSSYNNFSFCLVTTPELIYSAIQILPLYVEQVVARVTHFSAFINHSNYTKMVN